MHTVPTSRAERQAARRRRARQSILVSSASTIALVGAVVAAIGLSPGWRNVRATFFSWHYFRGVLPALPGAFWLDVRMFLIVEAVVLPLGMAIALVRTVRAPVEDRAEMFHLDDGRARLAAEKLDRVLVAEVVGPLHRDVDVGVDGGLRSDGGVDSALGAD